MLAEPPEQQNLPVVLLKIRGTQAWVNASLEYSFVGLVSSWRAGSLA